MSTDLPDFHAVPPPFGNQQQLLPRAPCLPQSTTIPMAPQASEVHRRAERRLQCVRRSPHGLRSGGHPQQFQLHSLCCCLNDSSLQLPRFPPHSASVTPLLFDSSKSIYMQLNMSPGHREQQDEDDDGELLMWEIGNCESLQLRQDCSQILYNWCYGGLSFSFRTTF